MGMMSNGDDILVSASKSAILMQYYFQNILNKSPSGLHSQISSIEFSK